jgi:hypothetical protein
MLRKIKFKYGIFQVVKRLKQSIGLETSTKLNTSIPRDIASPTLDYSQQVQQVKTHKFVFTNNHLTKST